MPGVPNVPDIPDVPNVPDVPDVPVVPPVPQVHDRPQRFFGGLVSAAFSSFVDGGPSFCGCLAAARSYAANASDCQTEAGCQWHGRLVNGRSHPFYHRPIVHRLSHIAHHMHWHPRFCRHPGPGHWSRRWIFAGLDCSRQPAGTMAS